MGPTLLVPIGLWIGFAVLVMLLLGADLAQQLAQQRSGRTPSPAQAGRFCLVVLLVASAFAGAITYLLGREAGLTFVTGFLVEEALSVDNLFIFLVIFDFFKVTPQQQQRVLLWGVLGALVMRAACILAGSALVRAFHGLFYLFGAILVYTGIKLLRPDTGHFSPESSRLVRLYRRFIPCTDTFVGDRFMVATPSGLRTTPLMLVLVVVEASDIVFALDSIPAIFAISTEPFIVYTSNVFAILGLRSLYFVLAGLMHELRYLRVGLGLILAFVGGKMLLADSLPIGTLTSLAVIVFLLGGAIIASLAANRRSTA